MIYLFSIKYHLLWIQIRLGPQLSQKAQSFYQQNLVLSLENVWCGKKRSTSWKQVNKESLRKDVNNFQFFSKSPSASRKPGRSLLLGHQIDTPLLWRQRCSWHVPKPPWRLKSSWGIVLNCQVLRQNWCGNSVDCSLVAVFPLLAKMSGVQWASFTR